MKAKTELLLYRLFWLAGKPFSRGFFDLSESFECWAYRNGMLNQIHQLEAQGFLEANHDPASGKRLHRLTEAGRMVVLHRRDPETAWSTPWDRQWRLFLFDIPELEKSKRRQLTRVLAKVGCGCLQGSVWIAPSTPPEIEKLIAMDDPDCTHLLMLHADSKGPKVDAKMVEGAWDFNAINVAYRNLQDVLDRFDGVAKTTTRDALAEWTADEHAATSAIFRIDPLLPSALHPKEYAGRKVWKNRLEIMAAASRTAASLSTNPAGDPPPSPPSPASPPL